MAQIPRINLLSRDFTSIRQSADAFLKARYGSFWKDFQSSGVGPSILDVVSYAHTNRSFYYDQLVQQAFLPTVDQPYAARQLARQLGYPLRGRTSSSVPVVLQPEPAQQAQITIPAGTKLSAGGKSFEFSVDTVIPAGRSVFPASADSSTPYVVEGSSQSDSFTSDGSPFQEHEIGSARVVTNSINVTVDGIEWRKARSLLLSEERGRGRDTYSGTGASSQQYTLTEFFVVADKDDANAPTVLVDGVEWVQVDAFSGGPNEYQVSVDPDGVTVLLFGSASSGSAPAVNAVIDVLYLAIGPQQKFEVTQRQDGRPVILFGNDLYGAIPPSGAVVNVSYRIGGGIDGNVASNTISTSVSGELPNGAQVSVQVKNPEPGTGGQDDESVDDIRVNAPRYFSSGERAVTADDFTGLASGFSDPRYGAVSYARARLAQNSPERNRVVVSIWARDSQGRLIGASSSLQAALQNYLNGARTLCTYVDVEDGEVVFLDMEISVSIQNGYTSQEVFSAMQTKLDRFFNSAYVQPGQDVPLSHLYDSLQETDGVRYLSLRVLRGLKLSSRLVATADGVTATYNDVIEVPDGTTLQPNRFVLTDGTQRITDDGVGGLVGDVGAGTNMINYETGEFNATFASPPTVTFEITAEGYLNHFVEYAESEDAFTSDKLTVERVTERTAVRKRRWKGVSAYHTGLPIDRFREASSNGFSGELGLDMDNVRITIPLIENIAVNPGRNSVPIVLAADRVSLVVPASESPYATDFKVGEISLSTGYFVLFAGAAGSPATFMQNVLDTYQANDGLSNPYIIDQPAYAEWDSATFYGQIETPVGEGRNLFRAAYEQSETLALVPPLSSYAGQALAYDDSEAIITGNINPANAHELDYDDGTAHFSWANSLPDQAGFLAGDRAFPYIHFYPDGGGVWSGTNVSARTVILPGQWPAVELEFSGFGPTLPFLAGDIIRQSSSGFYAVVLEITGPTTLLCATVGLREVHDYGAGTPLNPAPTPGEIITQDKTNAQGIVRTVLGSNRFVVERTTFGVEFDQTNTVTGDAGAGATTPGVLGGAASDPRPVDITSAGTRFLRDDMAGVSSTQPATYTSPITITATAQTFAQSRGLNLYHLYGAGRMRIPYYLWSGLGYEVFEAYDNAGGFFDGPSLKQNLPNTIDYETGVGRVSLKSAPPAGTGLILPVDFTSVIHHLAAGFAWFIKRPTREGHSRYAFADDTGRLWGSPMEAFPTSRFDFDVGKMSAQFASAVPAGSSPEIRYEAEIATSNGVVPIQDDEVVSLGDVTYREQS